MAAVHGTPTRFEKKAQEAIRAYMQDHSDREAFSLYTLSTVADRAASEAGKKNDLYESLWDYIDILPATRTGWDYHGTAGGSEYSVRNPFYRKAGNVVLHAAPEGEELDQIKVTPPKAPSPEPVSSTAYQINNIRIRSVVALGRPVWLCVAPDGRKLDAFFKLVDARRWAETTHDFLSPLAMRREIAGAWRELKMPKLENRSIVQEHGGWWVIGFDREGDAVTYSVAEASGPGTFNGLSFE
jgi:hypothetical protein